LASWNRIGEWLRRLEAMRATPSSFGCDATDRTGRYLKAAVDARRIVLAVQDRWSEPYTRRGFLTRLTSAAAAVGIFRSIVPAAANGRATKRVIVVGAGVAGLCAAYELSTLGHDVSVLEAQGRPGGRVHTLRTPFAEGLYAEAGASRIPTTHDLTLGYARLFDLPLVPFAPADVPSIRYAYGRRTKVLPGSTFEWPPGVPADQRRLTPADVRRRYIDVLADRITDPFAPDWMPASLAQYDAITRDQYLRAHGVSEAALHMMNLGSTPVARFRSFLDVLHEVAVNRELRRRAGTHDEQLLKIDGGNDRLPQAFAARLKGQIRYRCAVKRIQHDAAGVRVFFDSGGSIESAHADRLVCAIPFSTLRHVTFLPGLPPEKRAAIARLPYHSATRIYLQCRVHYWRDEGLSGFADTDHPMEVWDATYGQASGRGILMSFVQGPKARELGRASRATQLHFALETVDDVYPGLRSAYERGFVKVWDTDPWARGAVGYLLPGQVRALEPYIARREGVLHFAGEHASSLRGWMQGAFESGRRVAGEVHAA
jgi:monoamine oxidase